MAAYLILGATSTVGSAVARRLASNGADVFLAGRNDQLFKSLATELGCPSAFVDASVPSSFTQCFERTVARFGHIEGVANCIGSLM